MKFEKNWGEKHETEEKNQNSSKKLKVREAFSAPEVPSGVRKKAWFKETVKIGVDKEIWLERVLCMTLCVVMSHL